MNSVERTSMNHRTRALVASIAAYFGGACIDDSERCGSNMVFDEKRYACFCDDHSVSLDGSCKACAADEVVVGGVCGCPPGEVKNEANLCAAVAGLGDPCSADQPCSDATYNVCAPATAGSSAGTCTSSCTSDADCSPSYTCAVWESAPYCRQFSGLGAGCASDADCAGFDATVCDTYLSHTCIVAGCSVNANDCPRGLTCCDLSAFGAGTACLETCP